MAVVHEKLYKSEDFTHINLIEYVRDLVDILQEVYQPANESIVLMCRLKKSIWI